MEVQHKLKFRDRFGTVRFVVRLDDLKGFFQHKRFCDYKTLVFLWCALIIFKNPQKTEQKSSPHNQHSLCLPLVPEAKSEHHIAKQ